MSQSAKSAIRRRRFAIVGVILLVAFAALLRFYYNFCNQPRHSPEWVAARIDKAMDRGLNYLHGTSVFTKPAGGGGELPAVHKSVELILGFRDHAGLRWQLDYARKHNATDPAWRNYYGMPGWPREELTEADQRRIKEIVSQPRDSYAAWYLHSLYPDWTQLAASSQEKLFGHPERLKTSMDLAHTLSAYYWLKQLWPQTAQKLEVDALAAKVITRLRTIQCWAPRCSDTTHSRLGVWLLMDNRAPISQRWIERILVNQNADGGWTWIPSYWRVVREMFGADTFHDPSATHTTTLALRALALYREQMRAAGTYPAKPSN